MAYAVCFASGQIEVTDNINSGAIAFAKGSARALRDFVAGVARLAYDNETWLVPGVPEAPSQHKAMDALLAWCEWLRAHPQRGVTVL